MMYPRHAFALVFPVLMLAGAAFEALVHTQVERPGQVAPEQPARDTPGQRRDANAPAAAGRIAGRVVAADTGRPLARARVSLTTMGGGPGRTAVTDADGLFDFSGVPAARYNLSASRSGYVTLAYGQRRPLLPGTPLQITGDQQLAGIELRLPRGSVISGHIFDELGDPMPGTMVQVMRYQYVQGRRQLVPAGGGQTDDRGQYRVWGLMPGEYLVSATLMPAFNLPAGVGAIGAGVAFGPAAQVVPLGPGGRGGPREPLEGRPMMASRPADPSAYAPTYYPGVGSPAEARPVTVGLAAEALDVNFGVLLVRTSRVSGRVINPDGSNPRNGTVNLTLDGGLGRPVPGTAFNSRIQDDGSFSVMNVPPGRYVLRARSNLAAPDGQDGGRGRGRGANRDVVYASVPVTVSGGDIDGLVVTLAAGATITGTFVLEGGQTDPSIRYQQFRVTLVPTDADGPLAPPANSQTEPDGRFTLDDVPAGLHEVRVAAARGWMVKAITVGAQDVTDTGLEVRGGESIGGMRVVLTNRLTELNGTVIDARGAGITDYTVLAFADDPAVWRPQSRRIATARPDQTGAYQLRGLPPGTYYITTIDPVEQGEWFDPAFLETQRTRSERVTIGEGETRTLRLTIQ